MGKPREIAVNWVQDVLGRRGLPIGQSTAEQVCAYLKLLEKWNTRMNLTARMPPAEILENLFAESFLGAQLLRRNDSPCIDIGSGAGFPGMAIKVYRPDLEMILMEPRQKRAAFLAVLKRELGMHGLDILSCRLEADHLPILKRLPAVLITRAVGNQAKILETGRPLLSGPRRVLLFMTPGSAGNLRKRLPGIQWNDAVPVPWNSNHVLLTGRWIS
jgi:16S rRNA (guanine527-N7)-methyltransferase